MGTLVHSGSLPSHSHYTTYIPTPELPDERHFPIQPLSQSETSLDVNQEDRIAHLEDVSTSIQSLSEEVFEDALEESKKSTLACSADAGANTAKNDKYYYALIFGENEQEQVIVKLSRIHLSNEDKRYCQSNGLTQGIATSNQAWSKELINHYPSLNHRYFWIIEGHLRTEKREAQDLIEKNKISPYTITFMSHVAFCPLHSDFTSQQKPKPSQEFTDKVKVIVKKTLPIVNEKLDKQFNRKKPETQSQAQPSSLFEIFGKAVLTVLL